jgi:uncharacterized membrane protein (UPF0127 family)
VPSRIPFRLTRSLVLASCLLLVACSSASDAGVEQADRVDSVQSVETVLSGPADAEPDDTTTEAPATTASGEVATGTKDVRTRSDDAVGDGIVPEGYTTVTAEVTSADGDVCTVCLWLADSPGERSRGLMGVTDLGGPVGMAFVYEEPIEGNFVMIGTPTPLSIAWFGPDRFFLNQTDMEPCLVEDSSVCERYPAVGPYEVAVEMFQGELGKIGIGPGSSIELFVGTESPTCALAR